MFTGIITEMGTLVSVSRDRAGWKLRVRGPATARGLRKGGSVALDGVCLTAIDIDKEGFWVQVVPETARRSNFDRSKPGRKLNLERPLRATDEVGGHFVQGHVDARSTVSAWKELPNEAVLVVRLPGSLKGLVVEKGSIAINGVSLTVASVGRGVFSVALIPHTLTSTNLASLKPGDTVNLEADILGKYVRAMLPG